MLLARIVGTVVATRKDPRLVSSKLLLARPVDPNGKNEGNHLVAIDTVNITPAAPVPEPAVYLMMVLGLGAIGLRRMHAMRG